MGEPGAEPIALTRAGAAEVIAYACGKCGTVAGSVMAHGDAEARHRAVKCCAPSVCQDCGKPTERRHRLRCRDCEMDANWMREAKRFAAATVVDSTSYTGPVFDESCDEYAGSLDEAIERIEDEDDDTERAFYVYACDVVKLPQLDAEDIISAHCERAEMHEDAHENCDAKSLQAALDAWHAEQKVESWMVDYSRVIVLNESAAAEYRAEYARRVSLTTESPDAD